MKLSPVVSIASGVASLGVLATCGLLLIQNGSHQPAGSTTVFRPDAVTTSPVHASSSHAVAKPAAVVPRSTVVVKKPTVQGAAVTDPSTDSAPTESTQPADPQSLPAASGSNAPPPPLRAPTPAGPTCWNMVDQKPC